MIARFKKMLDELAEGNNENRQTLSHEQLQHATAALLMEVATIDQQLDDSELDKLEVLLASRFSLAKEELHTLVEEAKLASDESTSLYEFTHHINLLCSNEEKYQLVYELWLIAYADNVLDKHEEHIIRRISDLIHVRHIDFIKAKHEARDAQTKNLQE